MVATHWCHHKWRRSCTGRRSSGARCTAARDGHWRPHRSIGPELDRSAIVNPPELAWTCTNSVIRDWTVPSLCSILKGGGASWNNSSFSAMSFWEFSIQRVVRLSPVSLVSLVHAGHTASMALTPACHCPVADGHRPPPVTRVSRSAIPEKYICRSSRPPRRVELIRLPYAAYNDLARCASLCGVWPCV